MRDKFRSRHRSHSGSRSGFLRQGSATPSPVPVRWCLKDTDSSSLALERRRRLGLRSSRISRARKGSAINVGRRTWLRSVGGGLQLVEMPRPRETRLTLFSAICLHRRYVEQLHKTLHSNLMTLYIYRLIFWSMCPAVMHVLDRIEEHIHFSQPVCFNRRACGCSM
jgi:hypothetical protein